MKILITGATGFIGGHLLHLLKGGHQILALTRRDDLRDLPQGVEWIKQDASQPLDYSSLPAEVDTIIHLAQSRFYKYFPEQATDIFEVNTHNTLELLEYGRRVGIRQFVFASSGGIYGFRDEKFVETDPVNPLNFYLSSKYCAELLIANYQQLFSTVVLRLFFVYGEGQSSTMLIPRIVRSVLQGQPVTLHGTDGLRSNPTYVSDVVEAIESTLRLEGNHLINVAGPEVLSLREVANTIGKHLGREPRFDVYPDQEPTHLIGDLEKMKSLLIEPKIRFEDGVARVCREAIEEERQGKTD